MDTVPKCQYFKECGGCSTQHMAYELQLENKKKFVLDAFRRNAIEIPGEVNIYSDREYNYRNRMDFLCFASGLGFRQKDRYDRFTVVRRCEISNETINALLDEVWQWFEANREAIDPFNMRTKHGTLKSIVIRASEFVKSSAISFVINEDSSKQAEIIELIKCFASKTKADTVVVAQNPKESEISTSAEFFTLKGDGMLHESLAGVNIVFHSQGFFQNNPMMAEKMVLYTKDVLAKYDTKKSSLIDLYGGVGTFGISLAPLFKDGHLIETVKASTEAARRNLKDNNIKNMIVFCGDASKIKSPQVQKFVNGEDMFVVTDPPRSGMDKDTLRHIMSLEPKVILYVSCNPPELAKDLRTMTRKYELKSLALFDLFPQTNHVEAVAELIRKS